MPHTPQPIVATHISPRSVAVIGGGPAGLMAAEALQAQGRAVHVFDGMPSVGRKFLLAGRGGLNLTHAEPFVMFRTRYTQGSALLDRMLGSFDNAAVRQWAAGLGQDTFVGSSRRVFPVGMKASPLLRAWLKRLQHPVCGVPVQFHLRHRWTGWQGGLWRFAVPHGEQAFSFDAVVLALGGGSWARLGSDGKWLPVLREAGVATTPLLPSNCGYEVARPWSAHFRERFAGAPLKAVVMRVMVGDGASGEATFCRKGECLITDYGLEGGLLYAASALLRHQVARKGCVHVRIDLLPDRDVDWVVAEVARPRGARSLSTHLKSRLGLDGAKLSLMYEAALPGDLRDPAALGRLIKGVPLVLGSPRPLDEAISTAGGVAWDALNEDGMFRALPGVFCAGEMLEWDAPTGGYLLTACLASGRWAGEAAHRYLCGL